MLRFFNKYTAGTTFRGPTTLGNERQECRCNTMYGERYTVLWEKKKRSSSARSFPGELPTTAAWQVRVMTDLQVERGKAFQRMGWHHTKLVKHDPSVYLRVLAGGME